jgi:hypothetical protein
VETTYSRYCGKSSVLSCPIRSRYSLLLVHHQQAVTMAKSKYPLRISPVPQRSCRLTNAEVVLLPVIGVLMTEGLSKHTSLYPRDQKSRSILPLFSSNLLISLPVLRFVAMFLSGTPSALNSLIMTMIYSPDGRADTLSAFLALQYIFMFVSSTALAAVAFALIA